MNNRPLSPRYYLLYSKKKRLKEEDETRKRLEEKSLKKRSLKKRSLKEKKLKEKKLKKTR